MQRWGVFTVACLLTVATSASEDCAWVLWVEYQTMGTRETIYEWRWVPESAYPGDGYAKCLADVRDRAAQYVANSETDEGVRKTVRFLLPGE